MEWKSILADLFRAYRKEGAPFALVHLALVAWFLFELGRLVHEAWALHIWQPGKQHSTICTQTLNVFVRESEELAPQGFLVPLTDFTDRLDSVVDGMVGRVHDLANLFLVVGIAGTVFGLFYFAVQSTGAESAQLGEILAQGLKTAFPVVFVGLCLYVLAHTLASFPEHFLRKWLAEATDLGLERRRRLARSQAEVLRNALEPIKNLKDVLTGAVEPAINQFRERLDQSFQIVAFQMTALREAVKAVQDSVRSVENGIQSLRTVSEDVRVVLTGAPVMLKKIDELHEQQVKRLQDLSGAIAAIEFKTAETFQRIQDTAEHFSSALKEFQALPDNLRQQLASGVVELFAGTVTQLNAIIGQFEDLPTRLRDSVQEGLNEVSLGLRDIGGKTVEELRERVIQLVEGIERSSKNATTALEGSANRLQDVASEAHRVLGTAFSEAVNVVADQAQ